MDKLVELFVLQNEVSPEFLHLGVESQLLQIVFVREVLENHSIELPSHFILDRALPETLVLAHLTSLHLEGTSLRLFIAHEVCKFVVVNLEVLGEEL